MASNKFATMLHRNTHRIILILVYAFLEWILIFFLFLDSFFAYLIRKFANYFGLKPPCLFCSRVDYIFEPKVRKRLSFGELVCENHAAKLSRLSFCKNHRKLAESVNMCSDCSDRDNDNSFASWVVDEKPESSENKVGFCSCCEKSLTGKIYPGYLLLKSSSWFDALHYKENGGLILEMIDDDKIGDGFEKSRESDRSDLHNEEENAIQRTKTEEQLSGEVLSDVGSYGLSLREVSEEDGSRSISTNFLGNEEEITEIHRFSNQLSFGKEDDSLQIIGLCGTGIVACDHGRLIPVEQIDSTTIMNQGSKGLKEEYPVKQSLEYEYEDEDTSFGIRTEHDQLKETSETHYGEMEESSLVDDQTRTKIQIISEDSDHDQNDTCRVPEEENESSLHENAAGVTNPPRAGKENKTEEEHQEERDTIWNEPDEEKLPETPTSLVHDNYLHKKLLFTEDSIDGSSVSEMDGGDPSLTIERLRAAVKAEREALRTLYAELEEERSASAISTNQTMAMITRLQEEKAQMQMEALQYQRMMEEQSEYDQEALQLLNDLMVKREKEKEELVKELEVYREKVLEYEAQERMRIMRKSSDDDGGELSIDDLDCNTGDEGIQENINGDNDDSCDTDMNLEEITLDCVKHVSMLDESLTEFEEERLAILDQLKALEEKLLTIQDDEFVENAKSSEGFAENYEIPTEEGNEDSNGFSERITMSSMAKSLLPLLDAAENEAEEGFGYSQQEKSATVETEKPSGSSIPDLDEKKLEIIEQVDSVYERLQALETDGEFLKHCVGSIKKGDKGMELLQEILQHLRDLRTIELSERSISGGEDLVSLYQ